ncbi:hypothetical protein [Vampirovibrio sp.]|uniref:hypothetical protein n=1 Tax=Vampirovibrio sp. TaxID=2717857 RepID=UPI003593B350
MMKRITTGSLARAIQKVNPIVTDDMVRGWVEENSLPAHRNPGNKRGWWYVLPESIPAFLIKSLEMTKPEAKEVLLSLGFTPSKAA